MFESVQELLDEHRELTERLADPAVHQDQALSRRLGRRYAELNGIVSAHRAATSGAAAPTVRNTVRRASTRAVGRCMRGVWRGAAERRKPDGAPLRDGGHLAEAARGLGCLGSHETVRQSTAWGRAWPRTRTSPGGSSG